MYKIKNYNKYLSNKIFIEKKKDICWKNMDFGSLNSIKHIEKKYIRDT